MPDFLTRKLGPLPIWAYLGAPIGIYAFVKWRQTAKASASTSPAAPAQPNVLYGGELSPEQQPGYPGQFSLGPDSLLPVTAISQTNGGGTVANAPAVAPDPFFQNNLLNGTGLVSSAGIPPGGHLPR